MFFEKKGIRGKFFFGGIIVFSLLIFFGWNGSGLIEKNKKSSYFSAGAEHQAQAYVPANPSELSLFGLGYVSADLRVPPLYSQAGLRWIKLSELNWGIVEPAAPLVNNLNRYDWRLVDRMVSVYQNEGFNIQIVIKARSPWASQPFKITPQPGSMEENLAVTPPKEEFWDDYGRFVAALVERYDLDGKDDMPGLTMPLVYYEIESEAQNPTTWQGSVDEYLKLLQVANAAAKEANPDTKIILSGLNFGDLFDGFPSEEELDRRLQFTETAYSDRLTFIARTLSAQEHYDIVEYHYNRDYSGIFETMAWIRNYTDKPVWAGDATSGPFLAPGFLPAYLVPPTYPQWETWFWEIVNGTNERTTQWYRKEQSAETVRKFAVGAGAGLETVLMQATTFWEHFLNSPVAVDRAFCVQSLVDEELSPYPVFYTMKLMIDKLDGFQEVNRIDTGTPGVFLYQFNVAGKKVYTAWYDDNQRGGADLVRQSTVVDLSGIFASGEVKVTELITETGKTDQDAVVRLAEAKNILLESTPVFLEESGVKNILPPTGLTIR